MDLDAKVDGALLVQYHDRAKAHGVLALVDERHESLGRLGIENGAEELLLAVRLGRVAEYAKADTAAVVGERGGCQVQSIARTQLLVVARRNRARVAQAYHRAKQGQCVGVFLAFAIWLKGICITVLIGALLVVVLRGAVGL